MKTLNIVIKRIIIHFFAFFAKIIQDGVKRMKKFFISIFLFFGLMRHKFEIIEEDGIIFLKDKFKKYYILYVSVEILIEELDLIGKKIIVSDKKINFLFRKKKELIFFREGIKKRNGYYILEQKQYIFCYDELKEFFKKIPERLYVYY